MRRSRILLLIGILLAASFAVQAKSVYQEQDSTVMQSKTIYDPTNYSQVKVNLERASRKTFWQRVVDFMRTPIIKNNPDGKFQLTGSVGAGYMRETGVMLSAKALGLYDKQITGPLDMPSNVSLAANVSVTGFYAISLAGNNYFTEGRNRLSYGVD